MSDLDNDQEWLKIDPADEHDDDESPEWILIKHDCFLEEEEEDDDDDDDEEDEDYDAYVQEEDDGLFFSEEQQEQEQRKELLEVVKHQVLPRLPAKSLLRLKSTSRQWRSYISSPLFVHTHSQLRRPLSGMFFHTPSGTPSFAAFDDADPSPLPDPSLAFLPEPVRVRASAGGLLCCRGRRSGGYYVCNPMSTSEWTALPPPLGCHGTDPAVAIAMREPSAYNFRADYHVVCAYEVLEGVYAFESFSSAAGAGAGWRRSDGIAAAERIVAGSAVSAGGRAYWRTTMQTVVGYDPEADVVPRAVLGPPAGLGGAAWEVGELGGKLCCVSAEGEVAEVRVLEDGSEPGWRKVGEFAAEAAAWGCGVVPLRTQSSSEAVVWEGRDGAVVARDLSTGKERVLADSAAAGYCADFLPYTSSLVHVHGYNVPN